MLYGHRGASAELPENTMAAFRRALDAGATALETDVHLSGDGVVVVHHDADGTRMAGKAHAICETPLAELKTWDVGWGFLDARGERCHAAQGHCVPTLAELLEAFPDVRLNVDIKQEQPSMVDAVMAVIREHGATDRVLLSSFSDRTMRQVRRAYEGPIGSSRLDVVRLVLTPRRLLRHRTPGSRVQVPVRGGGVTLGSQWFIDKCHRLGLLVDFWTIDDPSKARELLSMGADGIMTNDPAALAGVFAG